MTLLDILTRYFGAGNRLFSGGQDLLQPGCLIHDQERDYVGRDAICSWTEETTPKSRKQVKVTQADIEGDRVLLTGNVSEGFPSSPVDLHDFTRRDGKIFGLVMQ